MCYKESAATVVAQRLSNSKQNGFWGTPKPNSKVNIDPVKITYSGQNKTTRLLNLRSLIQENQLSKKINCCSMLIVSCQCNFKLQLLADPVVQTLIAHKV
ncbi:hypothetical protein HanIR_Chr05g0249311 [Helianthus annuus]|nr:hypothetical protein HanIR_Chr05g0249311 [Helianthus annuus]